MKPGVLFFVFVALAACAFMAAPASAMTLKECSALYQAAKKAGTLNGENWTAFRASHCGGAAAAPDLPDGGAEKLAVAAAAAPKDAPASVASPSPAAVDALLPAALDPKFAAEKPSLARLHTCSAAYRASKKAGTLNGLRWIQKGGGFYSLCTRKLKAAKTG